MKKSRAVASDATVVLLPDASSASKAPNISMLPTIGRAEAAVVTSDNKPPIIVFLTSFITFFPNYCSLPAGYLAGYLPGYLHYDNLDNLFTQPGNAHFQTRNFRPIIVNRT